LVANKLDTMKNRPEIMQWLQAMQDRHPFAEIVPMSAKNDKDVQRLLGIAEKYLP
jgi:GTP-binding protein Era